MNALTLYEKLWNAHLVHEEADGTALIYIDRHLVHEVTSPQAFEGLALAGRKPWRISSVVATADHNVPTRGLDKGIADAVSRLQVETLDRNVERFAVPVYFPMRDARQGIVHVIGPEQGLTQPGMTIVCGDSHTATHGAFGALAFGIGTSEVEHVLASQCLLQRKPKSCQVRVDGALPPGVTAKDIILAVIHKTGVGSGAAVAVAGGPPGGGLPGGRGELLGNHAGPRFLGWGLSLFRSRHGFGCRHFLDGAGRHSLLGRACRLGGRFLDCSHASLLWNC